MIPALKSFLSQRFNPRLHPLLAFALGIALLGLLLPAAPREGENHSEGEILARLIADELDPEHGPVFWLREVREGSVLYHQATDLCRDRELAASPNCQVFALLERLVSPRPETPGGTP